MKTKCKAALCLLLCCTLLLPFCFWPTQEASAATGSLFLQSQARRMALSQSASVKSMASKINIKQIKYVEAVKTIAAKEKNMRSFRWTPLLSFKFPEKPNMSESYEFAFKPLQLQGEISSLVHEYNDLKYQVQANVDKAYMACYISQEKVAFTTTRVSGAKTEEKRVQALLLTGGATQDEVATAQSNLKKLEEELASLMRNQSAAKITLSELIGLDVTYGYRFANPLKDLNLPRSELPAVTTKALENDHTVYLSKAASTLALMNINAYEGLMRGQYGAKMDQVGAYLSQAKRGQGAQIDPAAFRRDYDSMLRNVDAYWDRSFTIIFFTFTMEWLKGSISGTRYIEDDLYALYEACFIYTDALKDQKNAENDLKKQVSSLYEGLINARSAYQSMAKNLAIAKTDFARTNELMQLGKADAGELNDKRETYETMQLDTIDALVTYNELAIEFNRTSCGALDPYFDGTSLPKGDAYATLDPILDPYYHITSRVEDMVFEFGVSIPEGYDPAITHYELWFEGTRVGDRTPVGTIMRHLTLDYGKDTMATVRLYNGNNKVTECTIDTSVLRARLDLFGKAASDTIPARVLGSYQVNTALSGSVNTATFTIEPLPDLAVAYFSVVPKGDADTVMVTGQMIAVGQPFTYLGLLADSLDSAEVRLFDKNKTLLHVARFDGSQMALVKVS